MAIQDRPIQARPIKGFRVTCPCCGSGDATIQIDLNDLRACECSECGETFTPAQAVAKAAEQVRRWEAVARWVNLAGAAMAGVDTAGDDPGDAPGPE